MRMVHCPMAIAQFVIRMVAFFIFFAMASGQWPMGNLWAVSPQFVEPKPLEFKVPKARRFNLSNGAVVFFLEDHELPQVKVSLIFRAGSIYDPKEQVGLSSLAAAVLPYGGAKNLPADQVTQELELLGSRLEAGFGLEDLSVNVFSLTKNFPRTLELLSQVLTSPNFDAKKLESEKKKAIAAILRRNDEPRTLAKREFFRLVYGPNSPWGRREEIDTIKKISRRDLQDFHQRMLFPANGIIAVSGDLTEPQLRSLLEGTLGASRWPAISKTVPLVALEAASLEKRVVLIPKESSQQSAIRLGHLGVDRHHPDFFKLKVMDEILGGGFSSRLFRNVRSRQGLAYSVNSAMTAASVDGVLMAGIGTKSQSTIKAAQEVIKEIESMREQLVEADELEIAKSQIVNSFMQAFGVTHQSVVQIAQAELYGYASDYLLTYAINVNSVRAEDVLSVAKKYWHPEHFAMVVVGNAKEFDQSLDVLGPVKVLDPESGDYIDQTAQVNKNDAPAQNQKN